MNWSKTGRHTYETEDGMHVLLRRDGQIENRWQIVRKKDLLCGSTDIFYKHDVAILKAKSSGEAKAMFKNLK